MVSPAPDPVPAPMLDLLSLFEGPLKSVRFPDVDRAVLMELADGVRASAEEVDRANTALLAAKAALDERRDALLRVGQRALAYARVYAEDDAELRAKVDAVAMPKTRVPARSPAVRTAEVNQVNQVSQESQESQATPGNEVIEAPAPRRRGRPPRVKPEAAREVAAAEKPTVVEPEETLAAE